MIVSRDLYKIYAIKLFDTLVVNSLFLHRFVC